MKNQENGYYATFPTILRDLMEVHPKTKEHTTQKKLAEYVGIRPQTISLYQNGTTQPTPDTLVKLSEYFGVSIDFMLTGVSSENKTINEELGLSEKSVQLMRRAKNTDNFENVTKIIWLLDLILSDTDFYDFLEDLAFKTELLRNIKSMPEKERSKKYPQLNVIGYFTYDLKKCIEMFIDSEIQKYGIHMD